ncbi:hypothetical protein CASFOL_014552 [Castilleja foliolosa]|uniref:Uncharacterized protein n=1 Tax=Castilleja foliolosa TaxID=1961234 RepID=A0ABD3DNT5_9LAMI
MSSVRGFVLVMMVLLVSLTFNGGDAHYSGETNPGTITDVVPIQDIEARTYSNLDNPSRVEEDKAIGGLVCVEPGPECPPPK